MYLHLHAGIAIQRRGRRGGYGCIETRAGPPGDNLAPQLPVHGWAPPASFHAPKLDARTSMGTYLPGSPSHILRLTRLQVGDEISIADLLVVSELEQLRLLNVADAPPRMADILEPYPNVRRYMQVVAEVSKDPQHPLEGWIEGFGEQLVRRV